jgi:lipopolysaccharide biosynthesis protein
VLALDLDEPATIYWGGATLEFEEAEASRSTVRQGLVALGKALFHKLPTELRRSLLASRARARWLQRFQATSSDGDEPSVGRLIAVADATAFVADFENRLAVAKGSLQPILNEGRGGAPPTAATKLVAFYLPQFHPIPENDAWWGAGFTDWTNVAKAIPQFVGHHQPRLPGELGFYDLRTPGILSAQADLARSYGVNAFCFHYYWFGGKRLLERPLNSFLADKSIELDFCICWANENWTRRWDGREGDVLIAQSHSLGDHARVFDNMASYLEDERYLRIDGKPLVLVYRPELIADVVAMGEIWRERALRRDWPGLFLAGTSAFRFEDPAAIGFDALVEFPPHGLVTKRIDAGLAWLNTNHAGAVYDYEGLVNEELRRAMAAKTNEFLTFPGVMPGWDNEPRRPGRGVVFHRAEPKAYGRWLSASIKRAERMLPAGARFVFINAWNEWAEGACLEPDRAFGRGYLEETARVVAESGREF